MPIDGEQGNDSNHRLVIWATNLSVDGESWEAQNMIIPTSETALEFALLLSTGVPSHEAIHYFAPDDTPPPELARQHEHWVGSHAVRQAIVKLQGKAWQEMEPMERLKIAVEKHYAELAYFLYSHNYSDLMGAEKTKADTCREALERRIAGNAGKDDAFSQFLKDVSTGKLKMGARPASKGVNES